MRGERTALLVVDMLNAYDHDDADPLAESVRAAIPQMAALIERAGGDEAPVTPFIAVSASSSDDEFQSP